MGIESIKKENMYFDLEKFINKYVTKRSESMFLQDICENRERISRQVDGKSILVIGGAGSIGSSFIRAILNFNPSSLIVVDINENALTELTRDLRSSTSYIPNEFITYPMDYASETFVKMFRSRKGFDIVANFSAHKHVRSEKDIYSIEALMRNNVVSAKRLLNVISEYPPKAYFCVSTDKAANPVNIMGASKRIMEDVIFSYSDIFPVKTARFANVAFSNGSLPAGFLARLDKRQPLSAPLDIKRFFVSPEESGQICLLACTLGANREIFFPKLDEEQMMSFDEIATALLKELGYNIKRCESETDAIKRAKLLTVESTEYPVFYSTSNTSGEKSYEEFYTKEEIIDLDQFKSLGIVVDKKIPNKSEVDRLIDRIIDIFEDEHASKELLVEVLEEYLPSFSHIETGKSLDSKM